MSEIALIGKKIGMTREFYKSGQSVPVTVLKMETGRVIQVIEQEKRGYKAVQIGFGKIKNLIPDFTGEKGILTRVFNSIGGIFGENSKLSTLSTKLGEWTNKFKSFFTFTEAAGDAKGASGISRLFGSIGGLFGKITGLVTSVTESSIF